ncbi:TonB-dependent receptor domain-containing protein, partial [Vibrio mediterranei]|uniref:TonB-dependent receptor domain-containing protein n=1 Tax=Vibrio mediterranei TaxID=689 RepID=UPI0030B87A5F|nr:TonB-dependent receptor [Vibrio mediterranei]
KLQSWNVNLAGTKTYGMEVMSQYRYERFYSDFAFSYMRGKTKGSLRDSTGDDEDLPRVPPMNINLGLGYEVFDGFRVGWQVNWFDGQNKTGKDLWFSLKESESYTLQNMYVNWDVKKVKGLNIGIVVNNLTNQYYEPYLTNGVAGSGREINFHASYKY